MPKCCVPVEPIFDNGKLPEEIRKIAEEMGGVKDITENLIAPSSILSEFCLGVQAVSTDENLIGRTLKIKLKNIKITNKNIKLEITFPESDNKPENNEIDVPIKSRFGDISESTKVGNFSVVFPLSGIYWLELEIENKSEKYEIETKQRELNGKFDRGWSEDTKDEHGNIKKNFLRQPILVVDSAVVSQTKINRSIKFLTIIMIVLTVFISGMMPLKIHDIIKLTALFGLLIFLLIWYYDP
ncbi:MAG: hypothetical protein J7K36_09650 [Archaeoglobaceae archaeon]|nr:hypothetical protein [Archaeoglobaceae archaeon]